MGSFVCAPHVVRFRFSTIINRALRNPPPFPKTPLSIRLCPPQPSTLSSSSPSVHPSCSLHLQTLHIFVSFSTTRLLVFVQPGILYISASRIRRAGLSEADVDVLCETQPLPPPISSLRLTKRQCAEVTHRRGVTVNPFSRPSHLIRITRQ